MTLLFPDTLVLLKGAGDLGTGVAWRLHQAGFPIVITELSEPLVIRRSVAFASAVFDGQIAVEGVTAWRADSFDQARGLLADGILPVLVDPEAHARGFFSPRILIDAVMAKRNTGTHLTDAPFVLALGPGFSPKIDCHAVIETQRGHNLGRVLWDHPAEQNSGTPGEIGGRSAERLLRAPQAGPLKSVRNIGDLVKKGEVVALVGGGEVRSSIDGMLRGLVHDGLVVNAGAKIGDVDPRPDRENCFSISDKSLAIGGGALEAVLSWMNTVRK